MTSGSGGSDVVIVGCGIAGLSCAVSALQGGLRVTLLERAPEHDFGGNSRWTEAYCRMKSEREIADDFEDMFAANASWNLDPNVLAAVGGGYDDWPSYVKAHPFPDPEVISTFAAKVPETVAWLNTFGLRFAPQEIFFLTQNTTRLAAQGGGLALIERLMQEAKALGARVLFETTAVDLLRDDAGRITGILAVTDASRRVRIEGRATVLASGGYQGNPEMLTHYMGARAKHIRPVARGGYYNKGEGIRMALAAGAAPAGEYGSYHAEPVDPRSRQAEAVVFIWPYGILINKHGARFVDEASGTADAIYDEVTRTIADQPDGISWVIFDAQVDDIPRWRVSIRSDQPPHEAATVAALAAQIGLPAPVLEGAVAHYNAACPPPAATFTPFALDGQATRGLTPQKSNWARPIIKPPFRAFPIISANCFTFGGVKVNTSAQVIDTDGRVIPGLYAAGETVGLYHRVYTGATSVLRGAVFGRLAGQHAATTLQGRTR
jgi:tricarballylate dehydrogenase